MMKRFVVFIVLSLIGFNADAKISDQNKKLSSQLQDFQAVMEETFALRQAAVSFFETIQDTTVLSGGHLVILGQGMDDNLRLQQALLTYQDYYQAWTGNTRETKNLERLTRIKGVLVSFNASLALYDNYALAMYMYEKIPG